MKPGLIHDNFFDYVYSLVVDILIFIVKSIYFFAETVFLTILPNKLRKMKVSRCLIWFRDFFQSMQLCMQKESLK